MIERCENCKHLGDIYIPPTKNREPMHWDGCFLFAHEGKSVMYLDSTEGLCEMFTPKESNDELEIENLKIFKEKYKELKE